MSRSVGQYGLFS